MDSGKILGILIIVALILSVGVVGYNSVTKVTDKKNNVDQTVNILDESELNQSVTGEGNTSIETININIKKKVGGSNIKFANNTSKIYNITSNNKKNKTTTVSTNNNGSHLDVNIDSEEAENTIVLSDKYNYKINGETITGGFSANIPENAHIDEMNLNITAGGVDIKFNGGRINTLNSKINTGGMNIVGQPKGETTVNSEIEVGGLNIQLKKAIADIFSDIEVGGINPGKYQKVGANEYKGNLFDSSENKLIIHSYIRLGGVNTQ